MAAPTTVPVAKTEPTIKSEDLSALIEIMKQTIVKLGNQGNQSKPLAPCDLHCHFCGGNHFKNSCDILKEYIHDGKCMLHDNSHIALPGGRFIPGSIASKWFKECLDEWYHQNPQPSSTTNLLLLGVLPEPAAATFQLSLKEHIQSLEKELFALCACQQDGVPAQEHRKPTTRNRLLKYLWHPTHLCQCQLPCQGNPKPSHLRGTLTTHHNHQSTPSLTQKMPLTAH